MNEDDYVSPTKALEHGWLLELDVAVRDYDILPRFWTDDRAPVADDEDENCGDRHVATGERPAILTKRMDSQLGSGFAARTPWANCPFSTAEHYEHNECDAVQQTGRGCLKTVQSVQRCVGLQPALTSESSLRSKAKLQVRFSFEVAFWFPAATQLCLTTRHASGDCAFPCHAKAPAAPSSEVEPCMPRAASATSLVEHTILYPSEEVAPSQHDDDTFCLQWLQGGSCRSLAIPDSQLRTEHPSHVRDAGRAIAAPSLKVELRPGTGVSANPVIWAQSEGEYSALTVPVPLFFFMAARRLLSILGHQSVS